MAEPGRTVQLAIAPAGQLARLIDRERAVCNGLFLALTGERRCLAMAWVLAGLLMGASP
ncbi:hypothetical protein [Belnapia sp. F-4-1]|uniref:hypothetical protein n=1 Tax=Belnapia sp. F-4-1 TaxID=1545443 RepID=UPI001364C6D1|nr:hypothetical protein [Belnapia sp. F-4-1]